MIGRDISADYAMHFRERIANIIRPFPTLFARVLAAYQDAVESFHILITYFQLDPEFRSAMEHNVYAGRRFCEEHPNFRGRFFALGDAPVYATLLDRLQQDFPENDLIQGRPGTVVEAADAFGRLVPWIEENREAIRAADLSCVSSYLADGVSDRMLCRCVNVMGLGEALFEAGEFEASAKVLDFAEEAARKDHQEPHAWHACILAAQAHCRRGQMGPAAGCLQRIDEPRLRLFADHILTAAGDLGLYLLTKWELSRESRLQESLMGEARHFLGETTRAMGQGNDRTHYLRNLYFGMGLRRADLIWKRLRERL